ncbi:hypothetical protein AXI59_04890 [Bacillus nakamurai]|uniref:PH domain-containing protein n=1 Tax=Bacillus nakamurai TaxID=1793963 RepID=UPI0007784522|nr:PH domain-containing protein [Bacillus nakamurai]KXZ13515.1 hypothetical protein AXI59_04890 [Bacillus nakamurai]
MAQKFQKLNYKYGTIEYPIFLKELESIIQEFPKSERKFYEYAIKALKKEVGKKEKILHITSADPKLTKFGFMVITEKKLLFVTMKGGIFGGADTEAVEFKSIKEVDFDIASSPFGTATMQLGILHLKIKGKLGMSSKRTIRNIDEHSLDRIVSILRDKIK